LPGINFIFGPTKTELFDASSLEHCTRFIGRREFLLVLYGLMVLLPMERRFQTECSATLANLAGIEENRTLMLEIPSTETSLVTLVLHNLKRFMDDTSIAIELCAVIKNLACFGTIFDKFFSAGSDTTSAPFLHDN
jgi:hypothetical protein